MLPKGSYLFATATFASLDIAAFADAQFNATFRTEYKNNLAAAAVRAPSVYCGHTGQHSHSKPPAESVARLSPFV